MGTKREKPSTKARREGYKRLNDLGKLLFKLLAPSLRRKRLMWRDEENSFWLEIELDKPGWRDFMIRHTPALKRGGPDVQKPTKSKRRRQKQADRTSQVRSGLRR